MYHLLEDGNGATIFALLNKSVREVDGHAFAVMRIERTSPVEEQKIVGPINLLREGSNKKCDAEYRGHCYLHRLISHPAAQTNRSYGNGKEQGEANRRQIDVAVPYSRPGGKGTKIQNWNQS